MFLVPTQRRFFLGGDTLTWNMFRSHGHLIGIGPFAVHGKASYFGFLRDSIDCDPTPMPYLQWGWGFGQLTFSNYSPSIFTFVAAGTIIRLSRQNKAVERSWWHYESGYCKHVVSIRDALRWTQTAICRLGEGNQSRGQSGFGGKI